METEYVQEPPNAVQIELTEGCNLFCSFCGLRGIREKPGNFKFMTMPLAAIIAHGISDAGWTARVEFAMHGEPTMNPDIAGIIQIFRDVLPKTSLMVTSNGGGLLKGGLEQLTGNVNKLFESGLNVLLLDNYEYVQIVPKIKEYYRGPVLVRHYPEDASANPHRRRRSGDRDIVIVQDISKATEGTHSSLCNHAGAAFPPNDLAVGKRCAKPFRELSIRWDGNIALCCNEWRGVYKIGSVANRTVADLWQDPRFLAARKKLYHGMRDFGECKGCDAVSYRVGLLPDRMGYDYLTEPTEADQRIIDEACAGAPLTEPVLRPWELTVKGQPLP